MKVTFRWNIYNVYLKKDTAKYAAENGIEIK